MGWTQGEGARRSRKTGSQASARPSTEGLERLHGPVRDRRRGEVLAPPSNLHVAFPAVGAAPPVFDGIHGSTGAMGATAAAGAARLDDVDTQLSSLITSADAGDGPATEALFAALYRELRHLARRELRRCGPGAAVGVTSLLHEAYLDMAQREGVSFPDRARFLTYAARVMRGLVIDGLRRRQTRKRGGGFEITSLDGRDVGDGGPASDAEEIERLGQALDELAEIEPEIAHIVDLKFFCGFTFGEIAELRGVSERTVQRHWDKARIFLRHSLREAPPA
jgi:RNA polymerase sigma factor (TIGR02999 family)